VCAMVVVPSPDEEDQRRLSRQRKTMIKERIEHINRIKGLMACQGIAGFEPMRANARTGLAELRTGDGRAIPLLIALWRFTTDGEVPEGASLKAA